MPKGRRITVLGDGGWGTCLAILLANHGHRLTLWGPFPDYIARLKKIRENRKFLPGVAIPRSVEMTADLTQALAKPEVIVVAVPSQYLERVLRRAAGSGSWKKAVVVSVVKGIDRKSRLRMSQLIQKRVAAPRIAVLSGPSVSYEVARNIPTTVVAAAKEIVLARTVQALFSTESFRVYTSADVIGVELGGALKNVIAIACGAAEGLGLGTNTKAALVTRGLAEMARLGSAMGARSRTFSGLSGLGDLVTTCFSPHSRNRRVGEALGKGRSIGEITRGMEQVAEGVTTAQSAYALGRKYQVEMPITRAVYEVLYRGKSAKQAVRDLMLRPPKRE